VAIFYPYPMPDLSEDEERLIASHPKNLFAGPFKRLWPFYAKLPKLSHSDFDMVTNLLISKLCVEEFIVADIMRSDETGEFLYYDDEDWMPEKCLFDTMVAALREKARILRLFRNWSNND
jgi:hypothetical protein